MFSSGCILQVSLSSQGVVACRTSQLVHDHGSGLPQLSPQLASIRTQAAVPVLLLQAYCIHSASNPKNTKNKNIKIYYKYK
jgi:hypothetical protein